MRMMIVVEEEVDWIGFFRFGCNKSDFYEYFKAHKFRTGLLVVQKGNKTNDSLKTVYYT